MARVVIVDRQDLVRAGLTATLSDEEDLEIVGEAANGREALALCRRRRPDLVLIGMDATEIDGLAAPREITRRFPGVRVVILTVHDDLDYMCEALKAGVSGYILKQAPRSQLVTAIRKVLNGEIALTRDLSNRLLQRLARDAQSKAAKELPEAVREAPAKALTPRELEVLQLLALGLTNYAIARRLAISPGTVKNHVQRVKNKLGACDRTQAVVRGFELGLIRLLNVPKAS